MLQRFEQFSFAIATIYKAIQKIERAEMAKYGLKGPHVQCLMMLRRRPEGMTAAQLCEACEKDKAAISRAVAELERKDLLYRKADGDRVYRIPLVLTEKGCQIADSINTLAEKAVCIGGQGLTEEERTIFYQVIAHIADNLQTISKEGLLNT